MSLIKWKTMEILLAVIIITALSQGAPPKVKVSGAPVLVTIYEHRFFEGQKLTLSVKRCTNLHSVNFNDRSSSIVAPTCAVLYDDVCCQGASRQISLRLDNLDTVELNDKVSSISPCNDYTRPAPHQINESWAGHGQKMTKVAEGHDTAIYYNDDLRRTALRSHSDYLRKLWAHVKRFYGDFGPENGRLFAFFHAQVPRSVYRFNAIQSYFDVQSECRNIIDVVGHTGTSWSNDFSEEAGSVEMDLVTHEVSHIIEWASMGVHGSPTYTLWGDSAWAEIFTFDVYNSLGLARDTERFRKQAVLSHYDFPNKATFWFRDWFYPIYSTHGGTKLLKSYFQLLAKHFPKQEGKPWVYARDISLGEFVHFFSGAAKRDLRSFATRAFKWDARAERQLADAKKNFPQIVY